MLNRYLLAIVAATLLAACGGNAIGNCDNSGHGGGALHVGDAGACPQVENGTDERNDAGVCVIVCDFNFKLCDGACVFIFDPLTGCAMAACEACVFNHANAGCTAAGVCHPASCLPGFSDCDGMPANGCETHTAQDATNCGACGFVCQAPSTSCVMGQCQ